MDNTMKCPESSFDMHYLQLENKDSIYIEIYIFKHLTFIT